VATDPVTPNKIRGFRLEECECGGWEGGGVIISILEEL